MTILYTLLYIIIPSFIIFGGLSKKNPNDECLDMDSTKSLKGICALMVVLSHISQRIDGIPLLDFAFRQIGFLSVGVFFFLSGYGLMYGYSNKDNYLDDFFTKRLSKVYLPFIIVNLIQILFNEIIYVNLLSLKHKILYISGVLLYDTTLWFVRVIIIMYAIFYIAFKFFKNNEAIIIISLLNIVYLLITMIFGLDLMGSNQVFAFLLGVLFFKYKETIMKKINLLNIIFYSFIFSIAIYIKTISKINLIRAIFSNLSIIFLIFIIIERMFQLIRYNSKLKNSFSILNYK